MIYPGHVKAASHATYGSWDDFTYVVVYRPPWRGGEVEVPNVRPWNRPTPDLIANVDYWPFPPSTLVEVYEIGNELRFKFPEPRPVFTDCEGTAKW